MSRIYTNTIGARITINTLNVAIPTTSILALHITKPSGETMHKYVLPAWINYTTGVITYVTIAGDVDEVGEYRVQIHETNSTDDTDLPSNIDTFTVYDRLALTEPMAKDIYGKFTIEVV
jgi:hypothetical protein